MADGVGACCTRGLDKGFNWKFCAGDQSRQDGYERAKGYVHRDVENNKKKENSSAGLKNSEAQSPLVINSWIKIL